MLSDAAGGAQPGDCEDCADVAMRYFEAWNRREMDVAADQFAEDGIYEDLVYPDAFRDRDSFKRHLERVRDRVPPSVQFVVDGISRGDEQFTGVAWHVEIQGRSFPNTRGASFYRCKRCQDGRLRLVYGRDLVEPASKPGDTSLFILSLVSRLFGRFPSLLDMPAAKLPNYLKDIEQREREKSGKSEQQQPAAVGTGVRPVSFESSTSGPLGWLKSGGALWLGYGLYVYFLLVGTQAPGLPAWATPVSEFESLLKQSLDFWFITPILKGVTGLELLPAPMVHPVTLGVFNFFNAWSFCHAALMFSDPKSEGKFDRFVVWVGTMFLTNFFFLPYMALRAGTPLPSPLSNLAEAIEEGDPKSPMSGAVEALTKPWVGYVGFVVGVIALGWVFLAYPDGGFGPPGERWGYLLNQLQTNRIEFAFGVDLVLYSIFQNVLIGEESNRLQQLARQHSRPDVERRVESLKWLRFIPMFGEAAWVALRPQEQDTLPPGQGGRSRRQTGSVS